MVEAVGVEPTSEEPQRPVSPCAAYRKNFAPCTASRQPSHAASPRTLSRRVRAPRRPSPLNSVGLRSAGGTSRSTWPLYAARAKLLLAVELFHRLTRGWISTRCRQPEPFPVEPGAPPDSAGTVIVAPCGAPGVFRSTPARGRVGQGPGKVAGAWPRASGLGPQASGLRPRASGFRPRALGPQTRQSNGATIAWRPNRSSTGNASVPR